MDDHISRREFVLGGLSAGVAVAFPACAGHRAPGQPDGSRLSARQRVRLTEWDVLIAELMREASVPGAAIALVRDGAVVWHRAWGLRDVEGRQPVDERTVFSAASVSKTVFAYAVMQLHDRGVLDLDTPLTRYTPDRILDDPRLDLITARHVLSHTSGLPNFRSRAAPLRIHFTPGERFLYSGEGYWYLQSVMTHLAGRVDPTRCADYEAGMRQCATDIDSYLRTNVLRPCRMASSGYVANEAFTQNAARGHDTSGRPLPPAQPTAIDAGRYAAMGGLYTSALDYAAFLREILDPRTPGSFRLSSSTRQAMLTPQVRVDGPKSWALGWEIHETAGGRLFQHQGGHAGAQAFTAASLQRRSGYIILTNSDNGWKIFYDERFVAIANELLLA